MFSTVARRAIQALFVTIVAILPASNAKAQCTYDILDDPDQVIKAYFGNRIALSGNTMFIGAPLNSDLEFRAGAVYIFEFSGLEWVNTQRLLPDPPVQWGYFGAGIDVQDDLVIIGAQHSADDGPGYANIYHYNGDEWILQQTLFPPQPEAADGFAACIKLSGNHLFICAYKQQQNNGTTGAVYIYQRSGDNWEHQQTLIAPTGPYVYFGRAIEVNKNRMLISAPDYVDPYTVFSYHFDGSQWVLDQSLTSPLEKYKQGNFGTSLWIDNNTAIIGAQMEEKWRGGAYIYNHNGTQWILQQRLTASDAVNDAFFGRSVVVYDNVALIGAPYDTEAGYRGGAAYVFHFDGSEWVEQTKLLPPESGLGRNFGAFVTFDNDTAVISAPDEINLLRPGSVMVLDGLFDHDGDSIPDGCIACPADITNPEAGEPDGNVNIHDLHRLLDNWGTNGPGAVIAEPHIIIDVYDLLDLLAAWGSCT